MPASEHLDCPICLEVCEDACTTSCGHLFCTKCILDFWESKGKTHRVKCPIDRREVAMIIPNHVLRREVDTQLGRDTTDSERRRQNDARIDEYNNIHSYSQSTVARVRDDIVLARTAFRSSSFFRLLIQFTFVFVFFYFFLPYDVIPDSMGIFGYLDDMFIILAGFWVVFYASEWYRDKLLREIHESGQSAQIR
eukprot:TRINITY_DN2804_c0_g2_i1.p1 TRINITY_DN2804_c0_g2~~TRINITY_DN2804_c0_g2_i1.p1  ORF type:complete len:194 (-),score=14.06 TRINITY_DN2804_c0_g2_i1:31-612(-)